jgi:hypothetical protein
MIAMRPDLARRAPDRIKLLPRDDRGFPIPWFVHIDAAGVPDFRIIGAGKVEQALLTNVCWICGRKLAKNKAFVVGPMCAINRTTAEPPSHRSCAMFAAQVCPFLSQPRMRRNTKGLPDERKEPGGTMLLHNPGVCCVWVTHEFAVMPVDNGTLFRLGNPVEVRWLCHGQPATRREVVQAMDKGLPILIDVAKEESEDALKALLQAVHRVRQYLPPVQGEQHERTISPPGDRSQADDGGEPRKAAGYSR